LPSPHGLPPLHKLKKIQQACLVEGKNEALFTTYSSLLMFQVLNGKKGKHA
jgi:hypothetical protein